MAPETQDAPQLGLESELQAAKTEAVAALLSDSQTDTVQAQLDSAVGESADVFARHVQRLAEALGVEQTRLTEALDLYGQSIQSRLNTSSVSLAREFRDSGELLSRRLETVADTAVASIARQGETIVSAIGRSADDVDRRMIERSREALTQLDAAVARTAQAVAEMSETAAARLGRVLDELSERAAANFARQLDETETRQRDLAKVVESGGQALGEQAAKAAGAIEAKLNAAASSLDLTVEAALQRIDAKMGERVEVLSEKLVAAEKEIEQHWMARRDGMAAETRAVMAEAAAEVGRVAHEAVTSAKRDLADTLQASLERWLESVATSAAQVGSAADQAARTVFSRESAMTERLDAFEVAVCARSETIAEQLASQSQTMGGVLAAMEGALARQGRDLVEALETSAAGLNETFATRLTETETRLLAEREAYERMYAAHACRLDESAQARAASLQEVADGHRAGVAADLASALDALRAQLGEQERAAASNLTQAVRHLAESLTVELTGLADTLGSRGETLRDQIVARQGELIAAIEQGVAHTEAGLSHSLTATADVVNGLAADINESFEQRGQAIAQAMQQASALVLRTLAESVGEAQTWMRRGADEAVGAMDANRRQVLDALNRGVEDAAAALNTGAALNLQLLEAHVGEAGAVLAAAEKSAAESAARLLGQAKALIETGAVEAEKVVNLGRERLLSALDDSARAGAQDLTTRGLESQKALEREAARAVERLEATRATLVGAAEQSADNLADKLAQQVAELQRAIAAGAEQLRREFSGPLAQTLARVEAEGVELAGATRVLAESFAATSSAHREQLHSVFAREADALAATVASNADAFRRDFEAALAGADHAFVARGLDLARTLGARVAEMRALLVDEGLPLVQALDARSGDLSNQIEAASQRAIGDFERKAAGLIALLTRRGDDLLSAMTAAASESARKVADLRSEVDAGAARADASLREVERKAGTVLGLIDKHAANLTSATPSASDETRAVAS